MHFSLGGKKVIIHKTGEQCCLLTYLHIVSISVLSVKPCPTAGSNRTLVQTTNSPYKLWGRDKEVKSNSAHFNNKNQPTVHIGIKSKAKF